MGQDPASRREEGTEKKSSAREAVPKTRRRPYIPVDVFISPTISQQMLLLCGYVDEITWCGLSYQILHDRVHRVSMVPPSASVRMKAIL